MHEMTTDHVHEEIQLLAIDISTMLFETIAPIPAWRDSYLARDQTPSYSYLRTILQVLQWQRGGTRWVLKSPQHLEQFPALLATFPDATFVVTHRDPVSVTASMVTMLGYSARLGARPGGPPVGSGTTGPTVSSGCSAPASTTGTCCPRRGPSTCTSTSSWQTTWPWSGGSTRSPDNRSRRPPSRPWSRSLDQHPRGRFGGVDYDLAQFGIDRERLRHSLAFYVERFGVAEEP